MKSCGWALSGKALSGVPHVLERILEHGSPQSEGVRADNGWGGGRKEAGSSCGQKSFNGNDPAHSPAWDKPVEASLNTAADWDPDNYKSAPVAEDPESCRVYANP